MRLNLNSAMNVIGLDRGRLFDLLRIPTELRHWLKEKTFLDTETDQLSEDIGERVLLIACLIDEARGCFGGAENARHWFNRRNIALHDHKPKKIVFDGITGIERVRELISRTRHGIYS
ncbi:MAG: DUF2384 domain-containing protein [Candidatus Niyogibacteria bacterium]|nr:DUF2384 domain-containing protein [Candidatus Niyogibacteria bacterium]